MIVTQLSKKLNKMKFLILKIIITAALFVNVQSLFSQNIDSLENELKVSESEEKISILNELAKSYLTNNPEKSEAYLKQCFLLLGKHPNITQEAEAYSLSGKTQYYLANFDSSLLAWKKALSIYQVQENDKGIAEQYHNIGVWYYQKAANYDKALDYFLKSLRKREIIKDTIGIAYSLNNIGNIYFKQNRREKALEGYENALKYAQATDDQKIISILLNNLGAEYTYKKEYEKSLEYYFKSVEIKTKLNNNTGIALTYGSIAGTYNLQKKHDKALEYYHKSIEIFESTSGKYNLAMMLSVTAEVYREIKDYNKAVEYLKRAMSISEEINAKSLKESYYYELSDIYNILGNYKQAYIFQKKYSDIHDSIFSEESDLRMKETEIKYETEKKEKENEILKRKHQINELKIEKTKNRQYFLIAISVILLLLAAVIFNKYRYKLSLNTKLESTNKKLEKSEKNLQELVATKDKFFSIIAHDLRNPLSSLSIVSEMLDKDIDDIPQKKINYYLSSMSSATSNLLNLIENLLNWARTQTGKIEYNPEKFNLTKIINQNISLVKINADKKNISINNNFEPDVIIRADINLLTTVIRNLLANAVKFTNKGGLIDIYLTESSNNYKISIKDSGIGMSDDDLKKLFRIDIDTKTIGFSSEKGTGLGLILCKEFIEKNGGKIFAQSSMGKGSTFSFTIPKPDK